MKPRSQTINVPTRYYQVPRTWRDGRVVYARWDKKTGAWVFPPHLPRGY